MVDRAEGADSVETPTANVISPELDAELMQRNDDYEAKRKGRGLEPPAVRLVMPGVFEQWMKKNGRWGGQHKMPRCRSDRAGGRPAGRIVALLRREPGRPILCAVG